jgi:DhnA family fructose-bisphosphate aldolase class Ia
MPGRRGILPGANRIPVPAAKESLRGPTLILAADHRARGVITIEAYSSYLGALRSALTHCDGILASVQPLAHLAGTLSDRQRTYLSLNRTGLAGSSFELDDRLVTTVARAVAMGYSGIKHMTRIDKSDPLTADALELLGRVLEESRIAGIEALIEAVIWRDGAMARDADSITYAAVVAHDMGAPVLKVPIPDVEPGRARVEAVGRIVSSVGVPVLFLGGPRAGGFRVGGVRADGSRADISGADIPKADTSAIRESVLSEVRDVMTGGAAGLAIGRSVLLDPDPREMARQVADVVHGRVASHGT